MKGPEVRPTGIFVPLSLATTIATYLLIAVGGLVRAAGAGLGCPDWPRCFGRWIPPTHLDDLPVGFDPAEFSVFNTWLEYVNRLIGVVIGLLIFATLVSAWRHYRGHRHILWPTTAAFVLVGFQGWLGGQVVEQELAAHVLTAHLVVALVIVGLLLYAHLWGRYPGEGTVEPARGARLVGRLGLVVTGLVLVQVALGTRVRSVLQEVEKAAVPRADWLPLGWWPDIAHRQLSVLVVLACVGLVLAAAYWAPKRGDVRRWTRCVVVVVVAQILAGLGMAYGAVPPPLQVVHLALSALLVGALSVVIFLAYRR